MRFASEAALAPAAPAVRGRGQGDRVLPRSTRFLPTRVTAREGEMDDAAGRAGCLDLEPLLKVLKAVPQAPSASQDDGHHDDVHVVDKIGCQELTNRCRPPANPYVQAAGRLPGRFQGRGGARVDEVERGCALHLDRAA